MGINIPSKALELLLTVAARNRVKEWSIEYANPGKSMELFVEDINNEKSPLFRFADDCIIFANSREKVDQILLSMNALLKPRGLELNLNKTKVKDLRKGEPVPFVGFEFSTTRNHGKWKVSNYPPRAKIRNLKAKVEQAIQKDKKNL